MKFEIKGPGIKITQPDAEVIKVVEGGGVARIIGTIILLGGTMLAWTSSGRVTDLTLISGVVLMVFGGAVATQRYVMILNRHRGAWSYGGDIFFVISFKSRGPLATSGPVRISKLATNPREHDMGEPVITYPVTIGVKNMEGSREELRFGKHWSLEEAHTISAFLARFLNRRVLDEST